MFRFMLGELAVCVFVLVLLGVLFLVLVSVGYLLKTFVVLTYALLQQVLPASNCVTPTKAIALARPKPVILTEAAA